MALDPAKETKYLVASKPPKEVLSQQEDADEIEDRFRRQEIKLSPSVKADLESKLWYQIWDWKNSRASLQAKLRDLNDLYEGVVKVTDFPWAGCFDKETEILTFRGWKFFKDLGKDDFVYSYNPKTGLCSYQPITAFQKYKAPHLIYFKGKSLDLAVTPNHKMFLWSELEDKYEFLDAEHLLKINGYEFKVPIAFDGWRAKAVDKIYGFEAEDWMAFLGWFISEGYSGCKDASCYPIIHICQSKEANPEKCEEIEELFKHMGLQYTFDGKQYYVRGIPQEARLELYRLGDASEKRILRQYLCHSQDLLAPLFESLIKGDGYTVRPGKNSFRVQESFMYYTVSKGLADDVQELAQKLGFNASIKRRQRQGEGGYIRGRKIGSIQDSYEISIGIKKRLKVGFLKREVKPYNDLVYCVTTPFHTLYVRRNGKAVWCGNSSQLHVPIPKIKAREIKSTINRNTMRPVPFLMTKYAGPTTAYEQSKDFVRDIEDFIEDKIKNGTNIHQVLKDSIIPIIRDGTCPVQIIWETELERVMDRKIYTSVQQFLKDYPNAEDAGISPDQFSRIVQRLSKNGRYEIKYEYDLKVYDGPKAYLVPLIDFFNWPIFENEVSHMLTHGKRIWYKDYDIERFYQMKKFTNKEDVEVILKGVGDVHEDETLTISRDVIEGINRTNISKTRAREYEFYELIHRVDLDGDGVKEKYLLYYHWKTRKILRIERYPIRKGASTYFPLRIIKRDNRFLGMSLIEDIADLSLEIDILHRMRINSRTVTHVPSFKAVAAAKDKFDPSRPQYRFQPGVTFWLNNIDDVEQFDIKAVDLSGSIDEENFLFQIVNLVTGSDSGMSGQSNPLDPRAPAHKQQELLRQSSNRIDDYVEALLGPFADIGQFMLDLYYQYGEDVLKFNIANQDGDLLQKEIERSKLFDPNVLFQVNGTSVFMNPDAEFSRMQEIMQIWNESMLTAQDPVVQLELMTRMADASRLKNPKALLPQQGQVQAVTGQAQPGSTLMPTEEDKKQKAKIQVAQIRMGARAQEQEAKRKHDIEMALIKATHDHSKGSLDAHHEMQIAALASAMEAHNAQIAPQEPVANAA